MTITSSTSEIMTVGDNKAKRTNSRGDSTWSTLLVIVASMLSVLFIATHNHSYYIAVLQAQCDISYTRKIFSNMKLEFFAKPIDINVKTYVLSGRTQGKLIFKKNWNTFHEKKTIERQKSIPLNYWLLIYIIFIFQLIFKFSLYSNLKKYEDVNIKRN